ncbi:MAG: DUF1206 domain-containing protein [Cyanobacteria bacterium P01_G01_bin.39]
MKQWLKKAIAHPWLKQYILLGYGAKGTVYLAIGILAIEAAVIPQQQAAGTYLTLTWLADQLWGKLLVALIALALTGYVWRRLFQAILVSSDCEITGRSRGIQAADTGESYVRRTRFANGLAESNDLLSQPQTANSPSSARNVLQWRDAGSRPRTSKFALTPTKHFIQRLGYVMSALSYAGVVYSAFNIVLELGEHDDTIEDLASQLFDHPIGGWLILLGGIVVTIIGCSYIYGAKSGSYISEFQSDELHYQLEKWATRIGKIGVAARGIAFVLTGIFLIQSAISGNSEFAGGLQNAFRLLATKPLGSLWLGLIGLGLICYGLYMYVATGYRRNTVR